MIASRPNAVRIIHVLSCVGRTMDCSQCGHQSASWKMGLPHRGQSMVSRSSLSSPSSRRSSSDGPSGSTGSPGRPR